jgi:hypothetical protein
VHALAHPGFLNALVECDAAVRHGWPVKSQALFLVELFPMMMVALYAPAAASSGRA